MSKGTEARMSLGCLECEIGGQIMVKNRKGKGQILDFFRNCVTMQYCACSCGLSTEKSEKS